jgi:hypothetical protein
MRGVAVAVVFVLLLAKVEEILYPLPMCLTFNK